MKKIILASQSPSRRKILADLGYTFEVCPSEFEECFDASKTAAENAMMLAKGKAYDVFEQFPDRIVVGVDSIAIDPHARLLEKPRDREDAENMMKVRSGKTEILLSGICILSKNSKTGEVFEFMGYEETALEWQDISAEQIQKILETGEWEGKCGGIAIEGFTGLHVKRISGNYSTIMGFPVNEFLRGMFLIKNS